MPRSRVGPRGGPVRPAPRSALAARVGAGVVQAGPSMSTEPGWNARAARAPYYFGAQLSRAGPSRGTSAPLGAQANDASMLLSFERPAPAGFQRGRVRARARCTRSRPALYASPRSLKTAQKPQQPPSISGGCKRVSPDPVGACAASDLITVKIIRAHGGCLGTKSR